MEFEIKKEKLTITKTKEGKPNSESREPQLLNLSLKSAVTELLARVIHPQEPTYNAACNAIVPEFEKVHDLLLDAVVSTYAFLVGNEPHIFNYVISTNLGDIRLWISTTLIGEDESVLEKGRFTRYNGRYGGISVKSEVTDVYRSSELLIESYLYESGDLVKVIKV